MKTDFNLPGVNSPGSILFMPHVNFQIATGLIAYCIASGALVLLYLYRATARDVPPTEPLEDGDELKRFLLLLAVAAISVAAVVFPNIFVTQIRTAQLQNRVYCELLQPGMTTKEVDAALNQIGPHQRAWFEDVPYPALSAQATSYDWVVWTNDDDDLFHKLNLWLGFDADDRLVWKGRYISGLGKVPFEEEFAAIECPWTFSQSVTAR